MHLLKSTRSTGFPLYVYICDFLSCNNWFPGIDIIPALLHGDLWSGNVSQTRENDVDVPVIFDPAAFYGHDEFELGIITMFGGFRPEFFDGKTKTRGTRIGSESTETRNAGSRLWVMCAPAVLRFARFIFSSRFCTPYSLPFVDSKKTRLSESH